MAALINPFVNVFNLSDNAQLELSGAFDIASIELNGTTYLYVAGESDDGIAIFEMNSDGSLVQLGDLQDDASLLLNAVDQLEIITVGGNPYLVANGFFDDAVSVFSINPNTGQLTETSSIVDNATRGLDGAFVLETAVVGGNSFVLATGFNDDAVNVFQLDSAGILTETDVVFDDGSRSLNGARNIHAAQVGNNTLVFVAGNSDAGITVFRLNADGTLTQRFNVSDSADLNLQTPYDLETVKIGNTTYLVSAGQSNGLSVFSVAQNGTLTNVENFNTPNAGRLEDLKIVNVEGIDMILATDAFDRVFAFSIAADGSIEEIDFVADTPELELNFTRAVETVTIDDKLFIVATGVSDSGVSIFEVGAAEDVLVGTDGGDLIVGLDGDDELLGRAGFDELNGGKGDDILSAGKGNDVLIGGAGADVLIGGQGRDRADYSDAAGAISVNLGTGFGTRGEANGDVLIGIEQVTGSRFNDTINGDNFANTISGGRGSDVINGGNGFDTLFGNNGFDTINGGRGNDNINGGGGNDSLRGGRGNDNVKGDRGNDSLNGERGNDTLTGGQGNDVFVFGNSFGADTITDFTNGQDVIDMSGVSSVSGINGLNIFELAGDTFVQEAASTSNFVVLEGVSSSTINADDFIF